MTDNVDPKNAQPDTDSKTAKSPPGMSRRTALAAVSGAAVSATAGACARPQRAESTDTAGETAPIDGTGSALMPVVYLPHGGGPWPFVNVGFGTPDMWDGLAAYLRTVPDVPTERPRALLVISAHWEEAVPTVTTGTNPGLLYDYSGFPDAAYSLEWPAPGHPELAQRIRELLEGAGFGTAANASRGYDHGTFVPLKVAYPQPDIPVVQLSLIRGLDPARHLAMGRALAPLREQGVFIIASGMSFHNLRTMGRADVLADSESFDRWMQTTVLAPAQTREEQLAAWTSAPAARACHPREEHLIPLMVAAGCAGRSNATVPYSEVMLGARVSAVHFGV